jgi:hypothetical protein
MTPPRRGRYIIDMSGRIFVAPHHSTEELERRYKAASDGIERGHLHIIHDCPARCLLVWRTALTLLTFRTFETIRT